jgi:hypothetical protein
MKFPQIESGGSLLSQDFFKISSGRAKLALQIIAKMNRFA